MFVQVITGKVSDRDGIRQQLARWVAELAPGATGWLGSTAGVAEDGTFVAVARFASEEAAKANSDRPEQGAWWEQTAPNFDGEVTFLNCAQVDTFAAGGSDDAGFVQFMQGRADRGQVAEAGPRLEALMARARPDVIGGIIAWPGDGSFTEVAYFTSQEEARKAESGGMSEEDAAEFGRLASLLDVTRYIDLAEPWLYSA
jgi:hypothetical protein